MTDAANAVGRQLLELRKKGGAEWCRTIGKLGDRIAIGIIIDLLPDGILAEEGADDSLPSSKVRVWIVNPLDSPREFAEGPHDRVVHIALAANRAVAVGALAFLMQDLDLGFDRTGDASQRQSGLRLLISRTARLSTRLESRNCSPLRRSRWPRPASRSSPSRSVGRTAVSTAAGSTSGTGAFRLPSQCRTDWSRRGWTTTSSNTIDPILVFGLARVRAVAAGEGPPHVLTRTGEHPRDHANVFTHPPERK